jgi:hypothetical protein
MENYKYQNTLINKKQLKQILAWSFTKYNSMQACSLADELKYLGFKYATQAGISISIEDLRVPFVKNQILKKAQQEVLNAEKVCLKGKITDVERFQKIIDTWSVTSESLKDEVVSFFKNYDPLNSVYIMAFSGARGNLSQVRQLVGMRGLMSDPSGQILKLPIKKNFREGLTITDYLMSGYGARKGIVDTALKTANSGYLTRRLIDVSQDIIIREKNCLTKHTCFVFNLEVNNRIIKSIYDQILGRVISRPIYNPKTFEKIIDTDTQITPNLIKLFKQLSIKKFYIRSPLTCSLYRSVCQKCYGWDLANENLIDIGEAVGIIAGQSIGEPGTQLTMRTFHTGGIFTSEARQQIVCSQNGIIKFSKIIKTLTLRTNRGEDVLLTKNSGYLVIIPEQKTEEIIQLEVLPNTILFVKNNQYIKKGLLIGELTKTEKQTKTEIKQVLSTSSGEIFMPRLKNKFNFINKNKLLWILSGKLYQAPFNSFLNFYTDHKINRNSYIFRTKLINQYSGFINTISKKSNVFERNIEIIYNRLIFKNSTLQRVTENNKIKFYLLRNNNFLHCINFENKNSSLYLEKKLNNQFTSLIENCYKTETGGIPYFKTSVKNKSFLSNGVINYYKRIRNQDNLLNSNEFLFNRNFINKHPLKLNLDSIIWLPEEVYKLNCDKSLLLVEHGSFISEKFELIPGLFSKKSGIAIISQKNNIVHEICIKSGLVYQGKKFKNYANKIFYPGEIIFDNIKIETPVLCQHIIGKTIDQLLIRVLSVFEISRIKSANYYLDKSLKLESILDLNLSRQYLYKSNQKIKTSKGIFLIKSIIDLNSENSKQKQLNLKFNVKTKINKVQLILSEKLSLINYIPAQLKYTNIQSCLIATENQFVDSYTNLGYFENITPTSLEIVKVKSKNKDTKQILLISNEDCLTIEKSKIKNKTVNDLILNNVHLNQIGKVIIDNNQFLTVQKGKPYFFPNCYIDNSTNNISLRYKILSLNKLPFSSPLKTSKSIYLNYYDITTKLVNKKIKFDNFDQVLKGSKVELSKMLIKKNAKLYSSQIPFFVKTFLISSDNQETINDFSSLIKFEKSKTFKKYKNHYSVLFKNSELFYNNFKKPNNLNSNIIKVQFFGYPFSKTISIHSITEDYFEQEVNTLFCKNGEFVDDGQAIGLLNFEKEITGDIVQGLPRIEELLEARKKKQVSKYLSINQKRGLLISKTSIDPSFEFRKLGTTVRENDRINPHNLLKVYFNYYGLVKNLFCDKNNILKSYRLSNNYEASYRSFKKVQSLILNSVQSVYESQGVSIADKHLEVIIKQMTTKVLITHEGDTPLLPREVIDLYHIEYINELILSRKKQPAFYVPLLLGVTKAALNNPSFISAASFQETTRVLTKAAIEGKVDWLRGLKENIIIGHLIPSGTGSQNYKNCFKSNLTNSKKRQKSIFLFEKT